MRAQERQGGSGHDRLRAFRWWNRLPTPTRLPIGARLGRRAPAGRCDLVVRRYCRRAPLHRADHRRRHRRRTGGPVMAKSAVETTKSWPEANARLREVRAAGYKATATDMGEHIVIHVTCGKKHADLS